MYNCLFKQIVQPISIDISIEVDQPVVVRTPPPIIETIYSPVCSSNIVPNGKHRSNFILFYYLDTSSSTGNHCQDIISYRNITCKFRLIY